MDRSTEPSSTAVLDRVAIAMSGLCMLHCLALPIVLLVIPVIDQLAGEHFHLHALVFVIPVSVGALLLGFQRHRNAGVLACGAAGLGLLILGATWLHNDIGLLADRLSTLSGSVILAITHYANSRLRRRCPLPG